MPFLFAFLQILTATNSEFAAADWVILKPELKGTLARASLLTSQSTSQPVFSLELDTSLFQHGWLFDYFTNIRPTQKKPTEDDNLPGLKYLICG